MKKKFNLSRYKELLKLEESGKISFLDFELLSAKASIQSQMSYNRKEIYYLLIDKYIGRAITLDEFRSKFLEMEKQDSEEAFIIQQDFRKLEVLMLANGLEKFSDLMMDISTCCYEYYEFWKPNMELIYESEFYSSVNNNYLQLQKAFPTLSSSHLAHENLISRSFKILTLIIGFGILLILVNISNIN